MIAKQSLRLILALVAILSLGTMSATPVFADEGQDAEEATEPIGRDLSHETGVEEYWTRERLESAAPLDMPTMDPAEAKRESTAPAEEENQETIISEPVAPDGSGEGKLSATVPSTIGRLFFTTPESNGYCTASATNGKGGMKVITAGHCVHAGNDRTWYRNIIFIPSYYKGSAPHGIWRARHSVTFIGWAKSKDYRLDQAFVTLERKNGRSIVQTVGGNGLIGGHRNSWPNNRIWGYPVKHPFDGETPYYCDGPANSVLFSSDAVQACRMNEGSSGGPWLKDRIDENLGYTWAVTSRCAGPPFNPHTKCAMTNLYATPNHPNIFVLLNYRQ